MCPSVDPQLFGWFETFSREQDFPLLMSSVGRTRIRPSVQFHINLRNLQDHDIEPHCLVSTIYCEVETTETKIEYFRFVCFFVLVEIQEIYSPDKSALSTRFHFAGAEVMLNTRYQTHRSFATFWVVLSYNCLLFQVAAPIFSSLLPCACTTNTGVFYWRLLTLLIDIHSYILYVCIGVCTEDALVSPNSSTGIWETLLVSFLAEVLSAISSSGTRILAWSGNFCLLQEKYHCFLFLVVKKWCILIGK